MRPRPRLSQQEPSRCKVPSPDFGFDLRGLPHHLPAGKLEGKADARGKGAGPEGGLKAGVEEDEGEEEQVACGQKSQTRKHPLQWTAYPSWSRKQTSMRGKVLQDAPLLFSAQGVGLRKTTRS